MRRIRRRIGAPLLAAVTVAALAACSSGQEQARPPSDPGSQGQPSSTPITSAPSASSSGGGELTPKPLDEAELHAVHSYLAVRENAESVQYPSHAAWRRAITKVTTAAGAKQTIERFAPAETSNAQALAHQGKWVVTIVLGGCSTNPAFHGSGSTFAAQCDLTDLVVTGHGEVVPLQQIDPSWPYSGHRPSPLLVLRKDKGRWLIDADNTGQAS